MPEGKGFLRNREPAGGRIAQATFLLSNEVEEELGRDTSTPEQNRWNEILNARDARRGFGYVPGESRPRLLVRESGVEMKIGQGDA